MPSVRGRLAGVILGGLLLGSAGAQAQPPPGPMIILPPGPGAPATKPPKPPPQKVCIWDARGTWMFGRSNHPAMTVTLKRKNGPGPDGSEYYTAIVDDPVKGRPASVIAFVAPSTGLFELKIYWKPTDERSPYLNHPDHYEGLIGPDGMVQGRYFTDNNGLHIHSGQQGRFWGTSALKCGAPPNKYKVPPGLGGPING